MSLIIILFTINGCTTTNHFFDKYINEVYIKELKFKDNLDGTKVWFIINNPTDKYNLCGYYLYLNPNLENSELELKPIKYEGFFDIEPNSKKEYLILVDMPGGVTDVKLDYFCKSDLKDTKRIEEK